MPSWIAVLEAVSHAWEERSEEIRESGSRVAERLRGAAALQPSGQPLDRATLERARESLQGMYDTRFGGFGGTPKFPAASTIELLLRLGDTAMSAHTLTAMARGGMYDLVGGGFARYSVDERWLVPHFEKMLYDNALLSRVYVRAYHATGKPLYRRIAQELSLIHI